MVVDHERAERVEWRRERDSNPRCSLKTAQRFSKPSRSATPAPLHIASRHGSMHSPRFLLGRRPRASGASRVAVRVGFEPTVPVKGLWFSRPVHSTTLPPHQFPPYSSTNQLICKDYTFKYLRIAKPLLITVNKVAATNSNPNMLIKYWLKYPTKSKP